MAVWHLGTPVSRAVALVQGSHVILLGGLGTGDVSTAAVWDVDPGSGTARSVGTLPHAVHDAAGAYLGGRALVFGGGAASTVATVESWSGSGSASTMGHLPTARSDLAAATVNDRAYVVGGYDGTRMLPDILATSDGATFSVAGQLSVPVRYPAVAAAAGSVWVVGGQLGTAESSRVGGQTDAVQRFDPATGRTTVVGHLPQPLGHAAALAIGGRLFVLGGNAGGTPSAAIYEIDTSSGAVTAAGTLPAPRSDAAAVVTGNVGWLLGGEGPAGPVAPLASVVELSLVG